MKIIKFFRNFIGACITLSVLSGCQSDPRFTQGVFSPNSLNRNNSAEVKSATEVEVDRFSKSTKFKGPEIERRIGGYPFYGDLGETIFIRAWKYNDGSVSYQIYVSDTYAYAWRFYDRASDSSGNPLEFRRINSDVKCERGHCSYTEDFGLSVSRSYLDKKRATGVEFRVYGSGGEGTFNLPAGYVSGFLDAVDEALRGQR